MELNINSPAYFSDHYGVDDEVYDYCRRLREFVREKEYSESLHTVGIMPVAAPEELYEQGKWKENIRFLGNKSVAAIVIHMDFEKYYEAGSDIKIQMMKETVLTAVKRIKAKGRFDYERFMEDIESVV
ncbi:MAG: hypothetical protein J6K58_14660 [Lachnospiraceae bacterium]|nr:hypothetical protein [Lachnospiraceae bacterium]